MSKIDTCPNCGYKREVKIIFSKAKQQGGNGRRGQFESTASMPPHWYNPKSWRTIRWFFDRSNRYDPGAIQERIVVQSVQKRDNRQVLINELELSLTVTEVRQLARTYVGLGLSWSKATTTQNCSAIGGGKHDNIKDDFLRLGFLEDVGEGKKVLYQLTEPGVRFLTYYLDDNPPTRLDYLHTLHTIRGARSQSMTVNDS